MDSPLCAPCVSGVLNSDACAIEVRGRTGGPIPMGFTGRQGVAEAVENLSATLRAGGRSEDVWTHRGRGETFRMVAVLEIHGVPLCAMHCAAQGGR